MDPKAADAKQLTRQCPECKAEIVYKTLRTLKQSGNKRCRLCSDEAVRKKTRSLEWRKAQSQILKDIWNDSTSTFNSEEYRENLSIASKKAYLKIETKENHSAGATKMWKDRTPEERERINSCWHSEEAQLKKIETVRAFWADEEKSASNRLAQSIGASERMKDPAFKKRCTDKMIAAATRTSGVSKLERELAAELVPLGWVHTHKIAGCYVDFYNPGSDVVLELFGDWWHCHPSFDTRIENSYGGIHPNNRLSPQAKRHHDIQRIFRIEAACSKVIVVWESELNTKGIITILTENNLLP